VKRAAAVGRRLDPSGTSWDDADDPKRPDRIDIPAHVVYRTMVEWHRS
jgi:hypothetical protein